MAAPEGHISPALAGSLARNREKCNRRFIVAQRYDRSLDAAAFFAHLVGCLDPIVRSVAEVFPGDDAVLDRAVLALYDISLELLSHSCLGPSPRHPEVKRAWLELLPVIPKLLGRDPSAVARSVSNAAYNLAVSRGDGNAWMELMRRAAPLCPDPEVFLRAGQAAAWRAGLAHFRDSALEVWKELPLPLRYVVLGFSEEQEKPPLETLEAAMADPWQRPDRPGGKPGLAIVGRVGGFRGFGGPFLSPPETAVAGGTLLAFDSECCWTLHADCYGATFQRWGRDLPDEARADSGPFSVHKDGRVEKDGMSGVFPELAGYSALAGNKDTLAVTVHRSHKIVLLAVAGK